MDMDQLTSVAKKMVAKGKGILAADESSGTIKKRFDAIGVESTENARRDYRELLFRTDVAMKNHISGVILYDETIRQNAKDGTPLVKLIEQAGSVPGIKVDKGTKALPFCPGEVITEGLDGLGERLAEYYKLGARFAKWRAVIDIGAGIPTANTATRMAAASPPRAAQCARIRCDESAPSSRTTGTSATAVESTGDPSGSYCWLQEGMSGVLVWEVRTPIDCATAAAAAMHGIPPGGDHASDGVHDGRGSDGRVRGRFRCERPGTGARAGTGAGSHVRAEWPAGLSAT